MTIALTNPLPGFGNLIGQGMFLQGTISGPTLLTDLLNCIVNDNTNHQELCGFTNHHLNGLNTFIHQLVIGANFTGSLAGVNVDVSLTASHAGGAVFDSVTYTAQYKHDPVSGLGNLMSASNPALSGIQADVERTFANAP